MKGAMLILLLLTPIGCASESHCLVGYSLGASGGKSDALLMEDKSIFIGVHGTVYFSTIGSCKDSRENEKMAREEKAKTDERVSDRCRAGVVCKSEGEGKIQ